MTIRDIFGGKGSSPMYRIWRAMRTRVKGIVAMLGIAPFFRMEHINGLLKLGLWVRQHGKSAINFTDKVELYRHLNSETLNNGPVDYLEFGVFEGYTLKKWVEINTNPSSRFFGFDSFKGLPETWKVFTTSLPVGEFDVGGVVPDIKDGRVSFVKGYFQDSMDGFLKNYSPQNRMVIHMDADLYTSTLYVLTSLNHLIVPGTIIIFDEFSSPLSEFRALIDYVESYKINYQVLLTCEPFFCQVVIEIKK